MSRQIGAKPLAELCHRLAISAESGIDARRTFRREAENARGALRPAMQLVEQGVESGESLSDSLAQTGRTFPRLFLEMVHVGEQSGTLPAVLHRLSDHYRNQHDMLREFRGRLVLPAIQLAAAVLIIGLLLLVLATLDARRVNGEPIDVLGLGVTGMAAVAVYVQILVVIALVLATAVLLVRRGKLSTRWLQRWIMRAPGVGSAIEKICLARLAWALHLMLNVDMDLRRLVPLSLRATGSDYYISRSKEITDAVATGSPLHEAFAAAGIFPVHFLESLYVAEESGQIVESMARLSRQYEEEAEDALRTLSTMLSFAIWGGIMLVVAALIFRLFKVLYLDALNDAMNL